MTDEQVLNRFSDLGLKNISVIRGNATVDNMLIFLADTFASDRTYYQIIRTGDGKGTPFSDVMSKYELDHWISGFLAARSLINHM